MVYNTCKIIEDTKIVYLQKNIKKMSKPVQVRFAPSPTGPLHIGGVRTAFLIIYLQKK